MAFECQLYDPSSFVRSLDPCINCKVYFRLQLKLILLQMQIMFIERDHVTVTIVYRSSLASIVQDHVTVTIVYRSSLARIVPVYYYNRNITRNETSN